MSDEFLKGLHQDDLLTPRKKEQRPPFTGEPSTKSWKDVDEPYISRRKSKVVVDKEDKPDGSRRIDRIRDMEEKFYNEFTNLRFNLDQISQILAKLVELELQILEILRRT